MTARLAMILAGGGGLRFWPASRRVRPKQLLPLAGRHSLVRETVERLLPAFDPERVFCVTSAEHAAAIRQELHALPAENVIEEPEGRDTAAAIALFAAFAEWREPGCSFCALPADHAIRPAKSLIGSLELAFKAAETRGVPVAFGIRPDRPSTQYGYLHRGEAVAERLHRIRRFREKPDAATAAEWAGSGEWFWNSGMFVWRAETILGRIALHLPALAEGIGRIAARLGTSGLPEALREVYPGLPKVSIDYGVMEKTEDALMVVADFEWNDLGSWTALPAVRTPDAEGNVVDATWSGLDTKDCIVVGTEDHLVATLGVRDLVVVHTPDATLVAPKSRVDELKKLVQKLRAEGRTRFL
jgi:mannose-1-phosphate guanylyltransferase